MSDLVKRLRGMANTGWNPIGDEAADEIEVLKANIDTYRKSTKEYFDRAEKAESERDSLRDDMLTISCTDDLYFAKEIATEALNHKEG